MKIISTVIQTPFPFENNNSHTGVVTEPILGKLIGQGSTAEIFEDMNDSSALYKKYDLVGNQHNEVLEMARQESALFNTFMAMTHQLLYSMAVMCISECYACQGFPLVILIQLIFLII